MTSLIFFSIIGVIFGLYLKQVQLPILVVSLSLLALIYSYFISYFTNTSFTSTLVESSVFALSIVFIIAQINLKIYTKSWEKQAPFWVLDFLLLLDYRIAVVSILTAISMSIVK